MTKLGLITSHGELLALRDLVWSRHYGRGHEPQPPQLQVEALPCLLDLVVSPSYGANRAYITPVVCTKTEAKRLVYPKTNSNRSDGSFMLISEDVRERLADHMNNRMRDRHID